MKKQNLIILAVLCAAMLLALVLTVNGRAGNKNDNDTDSFTSDSSEYISNSQTEEGQKTDISTVGNEASKENKTEAEIISSSVSSQTATKTDEETKPVTGEALFIGDSRTVGLMEYAGIENADFFCNTGMSTFNVDKSKISVPNIGKVSIDELLSVKKYDKIYIMLGINEVGYNQKSIVSKYKALLERVESSQPDSVTVILANLHVSEKRSSKGDTVNNSAINRVNSALAELADGKKRIYLDSNPMFDDKNGNLSSDKTQDGVHLYAKYYSEWGKWICTATSGYNAEG